MAKPIEIPVEVTGLGAIKAELKSLKNELLNATDPADIERLSSAAGALSDKLADASEKIKIFAAGSDFEKVSNGLGLIGNQLANLDFEGAAETAQLLTKTIKSMDPKEVAAGFKQFTSTVGQLSNAFVQMGIKLLANPLFLLVAVIVAVVVAIVSLKDKLKIAQVAFDMMMAPIKLLIQGLKDLSDWLGLTAFAAEEEADKVIAASQRKAEASQKFLNQYEFNKKQEIALLKANGKDTLKAELQLDTVRASEAKKREAASHDELLAARVKYNEAVSAEDKAALKKQIDEIKGKIQQEKNIQVESNNNKKITLINHRNAELEEDKKADEKSKADKATANKNAQDAAKRHRDIIKDIKSLEIANMEDGLAKELAANKEKYRVELEDLKYASGLSKEERKKFQDLYAAEKKIADDKSLEVEKKRLSELEKVAKEKREKDAAELKAHQDKMAELAANYDAYILEHTGTELEKQLADVNAKRKAAIDDEKALYEEKKKDALGNAAELERIEKEHVDKMKVINGIADAEAATATETSKGLEIAATIDKYAQIAEKATAGLTAINGLLNQLGQNRMNDIKNEAATEIETLNDKQAAELSNSNLTEQEKVNIKYKYDMLKYQAELKAFNATEVIKKKEFARDKALRMVGVIIDTAKSVSASIAASPLTFGLPWSAVNAGIGVLQLATIASQKYQGSTGPSAPSAPSAPTGGGGAGAGEASSSAITPSVNLYGRANQLNNVGPAGQAVGQNITVTAIVSESDITGTQNRVAKMTNSAEL